MQPASTFLQLALTSRHPPIPSSRALPQCQAIDELEGVLPPAWLRRLCPRMFPSYLHVLRCVQGAATSRIELGVGEACAVCHACVWSPRWWRPLPQLHPRSDLCLASAPTLISWMKCGWVSSGTLLATTLRRRWSVSAGSRLAAPSVGAWWTEVWGDEAG